ncbi:MAG: hypothetical protein HUU01_01925 [Saprospiraceae bacterium]|nr:hypothetical protein [Saprospiraceae bacterium]
MSCQYFRENHSDCCECSQNQIINASENKSKYSLRNPQRREVCKIHLDGCASMETTGKQCDYLFLSCDTNRAFFIELKGCDLLHAIDQLDQSIDRHKQSVEGFAINARVVLSRTQTPDIRSPKYIKFKKKIKDLRGTFEHRNILLEETLP